MWKRECVRVCVAPHTLYLRPISLSSFFQVPSLQLLNTLRAYCQFPVNLFDSFFDGLDFKFVSGFFPFPTGSTKKTKTKERTSTETYCFSLIHFFVTRQTTMSARNLCVSRTQFSDAISDAAHDVIGHTRDRRISSRAAPMRPPQWRAEEEKERDMF